MNGEPGKKSFPGLLSKIAPGGRNNRRGTHPEPGLST